MKKKQIEVKILGENLEQQKERIEELAKDFGEALEEYEVSKDIDFDQPFKTRPLKSESPILSQKIIEAEGWVMYEEGDIYASFELPNGSDLLWWKPNNHCEMDAPEKYDICYRGNIPTKKALQDLMSWMDIKNRSND